MKFFGAKSVRATRKGAGYASSLVQDAKRLVENEITHQVLVDAGAEEACERKGRKHGDRGKESEDEKYGGSKDSKAKAGTSSTREVSKRCGDSGYNTVKCQDQVCSVCRGKGHAPEICVNVVSGFACQATDDEILSVEEEGAFICDTPGKLFGAPVQNREGLVRRYDALKWKMGK